MKASNLDRQHEGAMSTANILRLFAGVVGIALLDVGFAFAQGGVYRCIDKDGRVSYENAPDASFESCKRVHADAVNTIPFPTPNGPSRPVTRSLKVGDRVKEGLVVEVRPPIARVQTSAGEKWFRIDELHAQNTSPGRSNR